MAVSLTYKPTSTGSVCLYGDKADDITLPKVGEVVRLVVIGKVSRVERSHSKDSSGPRSEVTVDATSAHVIPIAATDKRMERMKRV